ncbi:AMP-activated serine/threonine-protein kinase regulatory subunit [Aspergillus niger]|nr:AMP-activated serine/threonine-protein kinase regulatory subunit [Aspergillus niger]
MEEAPQRVPVVPTGRMSNTSGRPLSTTDDTSTTTTTTTTTTTSTTSTITALTSTAAAVAPPPAAAASPRSTPPQPYPRPPSSTGSYPSPIPSPVPDRRPVRGHEGGFVYPASFLRPRGLSHPMPPAQPERAIDREERQALRAIRNFLKVRTSYDVLPLSFRLIMFDTSLSVKESLNILIQNGKSSSHPLPAPPWAMRTVSAISLTERVHNTGIVSAPLWDSTSSTFAGLLTTSDYINVIQYYYQNPEALNQIDQFRLDSLREVEKALHVAPPETISIDPERPLYEACRRMLESRARRIPLVTFDSQTDRALVLSVLTQYRILKFVAVNVNDTQKLRKPLGEILLGSYHNIAVASMDTPVIDVIHILVSRSISSVPIINTEGVVYNVFEAVDVITLIKGGVYDDLSLTVGEALKKRSPDFPGIYTCSLNDGLDTIFDTIRKSRVHRLVVVDDNFRLKGVLTLSDILQYILLEATHIYNLHGKAFLRASVGSGTSLVGNGSPLARY